MMRERYGLVNDLNIRLAQPSLRRVPAIILLNSEVKKIFRHDLP
ncbi:MAG: hypothetical protein FD188_3195 [Ignavibacteria bacterium]|nr:MAG: hypothetical protein FD188_3195 [Ignavibacteria bacterium]